MPDRRIALDLSDSCVADFEVNANPANNRPVVRRLLMGQAGDGGEASGGGAFPADSASEEKGDPTCARNREHGAHSEILGSSGVIREHWPPAEKKPREASEAEPLVTERKRLERARADPRGKTR